MRSVLFFIATIAMATSAFPGNLKVPRVYNALIKTDQNLAPSRAFPVLQPTVQRTAIGYTPPHVHPNFYPPLAAQFLPSFLDNSNLVPSMYQTQPQQLQQVPTQQLHSLPQQPQIQLRFPPQQPHVPPQQPQIPPQQPHVPPQQPQIPPQQPQIPPQQPQMPPQQPQMPPQQPQMPPQQPQSHQKSNTNAKQNLHRTDGLGNDAIPLKFYPNIDTIRNEPHFYASSGLSSYVSLADFQNQSVMDPIPPEDKGNFIEHLLPNFQDEKMAASGGKNGIPNVPPPPVPTSFPNSQNSDGKA